MTKNQQKLHDLLTGKGFRVESVWWWPTFGFQPGGWHATVILTDEDNYEYEQDYHLGDDFIEAKGQIEQDEIIRLD